MLVDLKRTVAFVCPICSNISSKRISVFNFSGVPKVKLTCPTHGCHRECVTVTPKNSKYRLDILCPLCGQSHSYTASYESFWHKPLLTYKCPAAGIDIFFAGGRHEVENAIEGTSDAYADAISELWGDIVEECTEDILGLPDDAFNLLFEIIDRVHELKAAHSCSCVCGSDTIAILTDSDSITLRCTRCNREKDLEVSHETLTMLLNCTRLIIGD